MNPNKDYKDFLIHQEHKSSSELDRKVMALVKDELNPPHFLVLVKLLIIQAFIGLMTMLYCPQFNFSLTNNYDLFHYFHHTYGEKVCMMICGSIFMGSGAIFSSYILKEAEILKIRKSRFLYYLALTGIFLTTFIVLGADLYLTLTTYWTIGALCSGLFLFDINTLIRNKVIKLTS